MPAFARPGWIFNLENSREGYDQDWSKPKLIMNATRLSRGPWRVGAITDLESHLYSQQFFGLLSPTWPRKAFLLIAPF
jgi:hypothetical protein